MSTSVVTTRVNISKVVNNDSDLLECLNSLRSQMNCPTLDVNWTSTSSGYVAIGAFFCGVADQKGLLVQAFTTTSRSTFYIWSTIVAYTPSISAPYYSSITFGSASAGSALNFGFNQFKSTNILGFALSGTIGFSIGSAGAGTIVSINGNIQSGTPGGVNYDMNTTQYTVSSGMIGTAQHPLARWVYPSIGNLYKTLIIGGVEYMCIATSFFVPV